VVEGQGFDLVVVEFFAGLELQLQGLYLRLEVPGY